MVPDLRASSTGSSGPSGGSRGSDQASGCFSLSARVHQDVTPLQIVYADTALRLQALLDFQEDGREKRVAGDEWLFEGPGIGGRGEFFLSAGM